ncbi:unnamed protein product [Soboliphyme baturini]|uniref:RTC domain-containing protein n=1 Tax=Soboliphyme baturini TaxID=241478 RepID=A0A183JAY8_9BILA|nr:unnamed protein product [Soboliphyme baturini]
MLHGGRFELDCGNDRGLGYYLEMLCYLSLFCKTSLNVTLHGVTNSDLDPSVDVIKAAWFPVMKRFIVDSEGLDLKVRGNVFTQAVEVTVLSITRFPSGLIAKGVEQQSFVTIVFAPLQP